MDVYAIVARDGVELAVAVYKPGGDGPVPALLAASPLTTSRLLERAEP